MAAFCAALWSQASTAETERLIRYDDHPVVSRQTTMMGTDIEILVATHDNEPALLAIDAAFDEMRRIEALMTDWDESSQLSAINAQAGIRPVDVNLELLRLLVEAKRLSAATRGKFDVTYAGAGKLWDFRNPVIPDPMLLAEAVKRVDYRRLVLDYGTLDCDAGDARHAHWPRRDRKRIRGRPRRAGDRGLRLRRIRCQRGW